MGTLADRLPPFPWDRLAPYARKADAHPGGRVDLSVGTPVDPVLEQDELLDDIDSATESELFALLDEEAGP